MQYVFGPVPSRRLGQSLGIDTIPLKTCNWNCVYCQLGRTTRPTNQRREYYPRSDILTEVMQALSTHPPGSIDWLTFVGSGEPTLHAGIGWLIRQVKALTDIPIAVITNGSLLYLPEVREELCVADAVLPTLDAGTAKLYRTINRARPELTLELLVEGMAAFRREFAGKLWVEVMLIKDLNDTEDSLRDIAATITRIRPDLIHISLPTRPPVEPWVLPADEAGVLRAMAILGDVAQVLHPLDGVFDLSGYSNVSDAIIAIISRHPMREDDLLRSLENQVPGQAKELLQQLGASGRAQVVNRYGIRFWAAADSRYRIAIGEQA